MRYTTIPKTELTPSVICLGALPLGVRINEETSHALLDRFVAEGGNFIDTALVYGAWLPNGKGASEKTVGRWLKRRGHRPQLIIGTKGAHPHLSTMHVPRLSREEIRSDLEESLRNLQTDYIDIYWLHRDDPARAVEEILTVLNEQVQAGTIRYFGCSNWRLERIRTAQAYAEAHGVQGFVGNQLMWSLAVPNLEAVFDPSLVSMDDAMKRYHRETRLAAMAYRSQAGGFFAKLEHASLAAVPQALRSQYENAETLRRMERLQHLSQQLSLPMRTLALAYVTSQLFPTYALSGCSNMAQLVENLQAGDVELEPSIVDFLEHGT